VIRAPGLSAPVWLTATAWLSVAFGVVAAGSVAVDVARRPPSMRVMAVVWPITMLYGGPLGLWYYLRFGRAGQSKSAATKSSPVVIATGTSHCGAGCSLGDLIAEFLVATVPALAIAVGWGSLYEQRLFAAWIWDFVLAYLFGIALQYFAIAPMRKASFGTNLVAALKADTASILAWQVGMYAVMAVLQFWVYPATLGASLEVASPVFWFGMQWAMLAGFVCAYPVNALLISRGVKEAM